MLSKMSKYIDVIIPRGGKSLVKKVQDLSSVPVIGHLEGMCHTYIDKDANIVWVSLGFPKQEEFIYELKNKYQINSNLVGVGAVFEWVAKTKFKAPEWAANLGLEWILRLLQEPKRLFRRYLVDNFLFIIYFINLVEGIFSLV